MEKLAQLEEYLRDSLIHLHDPTHQLPDLVWEATGCKPNQGAKAAQRVIIGAIDSLNPGPDVPPNARSKRLYLLLQLRYVQNLTQVETAQKLGLTTRHLRREQKQAIQVLARRLLDLQSAEPVAMVAETPAPLKTSEPNSDPDSKTWQSQMREELTSLQQQSVPGTVADVAEVIEGVVKLEQKLALKYGVGLSAGAVPPGLMVAIHPSVLRQVLMTAIEQVFEQLESGGQVEVFAEEDGDAEKHITLSVSGSPATANKLPDSNFIRETLAAQAGSVDARLEGDTIVFEMSLSSAGKVTVLVVDDNADLVHFYRRYTARTRYQIVHLSEGLRLFETIETLSPDMIVLDIMLPDIDGWELLTNLYEHPSTRAIPVIICSVVKQKELASALGAALYLPKPVRRREFVEALDSVFNRVS